MDLKQLRELSIAKITEQLNELDGAQLVQLRALESDEPAPRVTLIKAIDDKLEENGKAAGSTNDLTKVSTDELLEASAKITAALAARGVAPSADKPWKAPDYVGPLTGDQAAWRLANLTKPASVDVSK